MSTQIICSDNVQALNSMPPDSLHACITDPPYGMDIAGQAWDHSVPPMETWAAVYRVLKPGAFLLSFSAPEYYHRMAVAVEDAGFRPLDMIIWMVTTKMAKHNRLKPAHEPIMVAQKPMKTSIEENQQTHGCGRINIDSARVPWEKDPPRGWRAGGVGRRAFGAGAARASDQATVEKQDADPRGRYPSNIIGHLDNPEHQKYFYAPRVSAEERGEFNDHPTPKPIDLMRYLIRIYSPQGGMVLDPFAGSGTTLIAAMQEQRHSIGIDQNSHYCSIAERRIAEYKNQPFNRLFSYDI